MTLVRCENCQIHFSVSYDRIRLSVKSNMKAGTWYFCSFKCLKIWVDKTGIIGFLSTEEPEAP